VVLTIQQAHPRSCRRNLSLFLLPVKLFAPSHYSLKSAAKSTPPFISHSCQFLLCSDSLTHHYPHPFPFSVTSFPDLESISTSKLHLYLCADSAPQQSAKIAHSITSKNTSPPQQSTCCCNSTLFSVRSLHTEDRLHILATMNSRGRDSGRGLSRDGGGSSGSHGHKAPPALGSREKSSSVNSRRILPDSGPSLAGGEILAAVAIDEAKRNNEIIKTCLVRSSWLTRNTYLLAHDTEIIGLAVKKG
jgi:hypothetical protein